ncbi:YqjF family protein [Ichthyenterobacterium magnum]|uniref:DUF2071 domain-containing protein n=1 Tax=Ichthyenterobacterium magnum TaxID=1230530 RepID=A0A420DWS4_9FLAO|nr:DUF2071 domain-containing protein [Ichthyenterobacterium magnum]RKE98667.1 hypothetical protein BXY80_0760 [Ichthyenterobacterium magnum]
MKASELLKHTKHRPFEIPKRPWKFYQEWNKAIFLHWEVNPELIKPMLPKGVKLDVLNGKTWVSLVAFDMNNIGIRSLPKLPHISDFFEINIRVYTVCNRKPSVYFLSMEGSKKSSCKVLKAVSKFPYRYSEMKRTNFNYDSKNTINNDHFYTEYRLGDQLHKDDTDIWLTERYAVFQDHKKNLIEYDVHHIEWPLQSISLKNLVVNYPKFNHIINNNPDRVHYSKGVQVITWDKKKHTL